MNARLFCKTGQLSGADYAIGKEATIGTAVGNSIQLYPTVISGRHARIFLDERSGMYMIEDFNSSNGTRVDGMPVRGMMRLERLNVITFAGSFDFLFQIIDSATQKAKPLQRSGTVQKSEKKQEVNEGSDRSKDGKTMIDDGVALPPVIGTSSPADKKTMFDDGAVLPPSLKVDPVQPRKEIVDPVRIGGSREPVENSVQDEAAFQHQRKEETVLGMNFEAAPGLSLAKNNNANETVFDSGDVVSPELRSRNPGEQFFLKLIVVGEAKEIQLSEGENYVGREEGCAVLLNDHSISRRHACITLKQGRVSVRDLGSKNHTFIESEQITGDTEVQSGQTIAFGMVKTELIRRTV